MENKFNIGIGIESFDFDLSFGLPGQLLDAVMNSSIVRLLGGFVCVMLAFMFGIMFIIGSVGLIHGKKTGQNVVVESQTEMAIEAADENIE
ncbi:MAG: hypothetical protein ACUZ8O_00825 [Candidatus Anammoxibacter sp.]